MRCLYEGNSGFMLPSARHENRARLCIVDKEKHKQFWCQLLIFKCNPSTMIFTNSFPVSNVQRSRTFLSLLRILPWRSFVVNINKSAFMSIIRKKPGDAMPLLSPAQTTAVLSRIFTAAFDAPQWLFEMDIYQRLHLHPRRGKIIHPRTHLFLSLGNVWKHIA